MTRFANAASALTFTLHTVGHNALRSAAQQGPSAELLDAMCLQLG
jgi:hypothetical protein